jgi:dTDP-4-amino-4,6-dideoxygalactose transaminase
MSQLAVLGGAPVRSTPFPGYRTIAEEERQAVDRVMEGGSLSRYLGCWGDMFLGGPQVRALEEEWAAFFGVRHAIAVNSCTSGLICAVGAVGVEPGDEVIVSPYTMSATAVAPLIFGGIPQFADVHPQTYCIDPESVRAKITPRTKAIMAVDLFGHPYDAAQINRLAQEFGLKVIEDCAQAPGARLQGRYAGTLGDVGVFSLNYHKHIHCGEGGIVVCDDDEIADRVRLIRNHAESVVGAKGESNLVNMVGFNFRMTEIEAAIARCQLQKLTRLNQQRLANVQRLERGLAEIPAIALPYVQPGAEHVYYVHACLFDAELAGVSRDRFVQAVAAELPVFTGREREGVKISAGYVRPLYLLPMFQQQIAFGRRGYPFSLLPPEAAISYRKGICPVVERLHEHTLFLHELFHPGMAADDLTEVLTAFAKVWELRKDLACIAHG